MASLLRCCAVACSILATAARVEGHSPVDFLEVFEVEAARSIDHAVDLKSQVDSERSESLLSGPKFFSRGVGCMGRPARTRLAYLNWLKIVDSSDSVARDISVLDMVRGGSNKTLTIGAAEYFLTPAQLISTGPPDAVPHGLDHYKAYRVMDGVAVDQEVIVKGSPGPANRRVGRPVFVCLPVQEWHHDEYFSISHAENCFVVYELNELDHVENVSTIDQFGLNELRAAKSRWLCVSAAHLKSPAE